MFRPDTENLRAHLRTRAAEVARDAERTRQVKEAAVSRASRSARTAARALRGLPTAVRTFADRLDRAGPREVELDREAS
jgi:hypothetical protein